MSWLFPNEEEMVEWQIKQNEKVFESNKKTAEAWNRKGFNMVHGFPEAILPQQKYCPYCGKKNKK